MRAIVLSFLTILLIASCIPTRIAPNIETNKIKIAKKFKRDLPKQNAFIFEDPKGENHFYTFINKKYKRENIDVESNVPIQIKNITYYLSFYKTEIQDKMINLLPFFIDAKREQKGNKPLFEDSYSSEKGNYYLVLTVTDENFKDCLSENYKHREEIAKFLEKIRIEYLNTYNYEELVLQKKS